MVSAREQSATASIRLSVFTEASFELQSFWPCRRRQPSDISYARGEPGHRRDSSRENVVFRRDSTTAICSWFERGGHRWAESSTAATVGRGLFVRKWGPGARRL